MSLPGKDAGPKVGEERVALAARRREEAEDRWRNFATGCVGEDDRGSREGVVAEDADFGGERLTSDDHSTALGNTSEHSGDSPDSIIPSSHIASSTPSSSARVHLPMPPRSMMVLYGPARDTWVHEVRRCDIKAKRIAIAFRELAEEFLPGGKSEEVGKNVLERAARFDGVSRIEC